MPIGLNNTDIEVDYGDGNVFNINIPKYNITNTIETLNEELPVITKDILTRTQYDTQSNNVNIEEGDINGTNEKYIAYKYTSLNDNGFGQTEYNLNFNNPVLCDILVVAGGGAGGGNGQGGGGGAGALIYYEDIILQGDYTIKVGNGGINGNAANSGNSGYDSEFKRASDGKQQFLAKGGGGGGTWNSGGYLAKNGGSGGGGAGDSTSGKLIAGNIINDIAINIITGSTNVVDYYDITMFPGDNGIDSLNDIGCFGNYGGIEMSGGHDDWGAGGGGAGSKGKPTSESMGVQYAGDGGSGKKYNITGTEVYYAAGGGGGIRPINNSLSLAQVGEGGLGGGGAGGGGGDGTDNSNLDSSGIDAQPHTGSGGGGVGAVTPANYKGGNGGSGIIIIRYKNENISNDVYIPQGDNAIDYTILDCDSTNLVAHYKFDEGEEYTDSASGIHNLIDISKTSLFNNTHKIFGKSAYESGIEAKLQIPYSIASQISEISSITGITFSFWFNMSTNSGDWASLFDFCDTASDTTSTNRIGISKNNTANSIWIGIKENNVTTSITCGVVDNKWHHIIWSIDNKGIWRVYFDGINQYPNKYKKIPQIYNYNYSYLFGNIYSSQTIGFIDDFRIYNKVLNPLEIHYLANKSIKLVPKEIDSEYNLLTFLYHNDLNSNNDQTEYNLTFDSQTECDILVVGGGGGGGDPHGGGGGAGQLVFIHQATLNGTYSVKVGNGGIGGLYNSRQATKGKDSSFHNVIAEGGGANSNTASDKDGGSGAGGDGYTFGGGTAGAGSKNTNIDTFSGAIVYSRGNNGGIVSSVNERAGGGGGAGSIGESGSFTIPGKGGDGLSGISEINYDFKTNFGNYGNLEADGKYYFAGGGGGGNSTFANGSKGGGGNGGWTNTNMGGNGVATTGSGGGGGGGGTDAAGGNGGSGIVLVRYKRNMDTPTITISKLAQWTYNYTNPNVYHPGNVGIGTFPVSNYSLNVKGDVKFNKLYKDGILINTGIVKELEYTFPYFTCSPNVSSTTIPGTSYKYIAFKYNPNNDNGSGQTEYDFTLLSDIKCDILLVGGGGGAGCFGGGGGGGGLLFAESAIMKANNYTIKVGNGGLGHQIYAGNANGNNGYNSVITINNVDVIAYGGGGGGTRQNSPYHGRNGNSGGSGGGGSHHNSGQTIGGTSTQTSYSVDGIYFVGYGNSGGKGRNGTAGGEPSHSSGGGGGAGYAGEDAIQSTQGDRTWPTYGGGGDGGVGMDLSSYFGTDVGHKGWFAGGGGSHTYYYNGRVGWGNSYNGTHDNIRGFGGGGDGAWDFTNRFSAQHGMSHTGGGGGGGGVTSNTSGNGGSGIVIIRYLDESHANEHTLTNYSDNNLLINNNNSNYDIYNIMSFKYLDNIITNMYPTFSQDTTHLIVHYKFDGNYNDSNPQNTKYHLTNVGTDLVEEDDYIKSVYIDSDSDQLYTTNNMPAIISTSTYSWCCWVKQNNERWGANYFIFSQGVSATSTEIGALFINNNTLRFYVFSYDLDITLPFFDTAVKSRYNHYVFTINNNTIKIYINGILIGSRSVSANISSNKLYIGKRGTTYSRINVADFRIYDKELTATEVYNLYTLYNEQTSYSVTFNEPTECDILVIGGGGAGAASDGGGGGAGSCIVSIGNILNGSYTIKVGKGGDGGILNSSANITKPSTNGANTSIFNNSGVEIFRAVGGGRGGGYENYNNWTSLADFQGKDGGCGGGGGFRQTTSYTPAGNPSATNIVNGIPNLSPIVTSTYGIYGNSGGLAQQWTTNNYNTANCGGGGGIGTEGAPGVASLNRSGVGGDGLNQVVINSVTYNFDNYFLRGMYGVNGYIGGGGGGGGYSNSNAKVSGGLGGGGIGDNTNANSAFLDAPTNGIPSTGSGGGGGSGNAGANGGNGGSGIVIIRYKTNITTPFNYRLKEWKYNSEGNNNTYFMGNVGIGVTNPSVALEVAGTISKTSLSFKIQHPLNNNKWLHHGSLEGPRYDNIYRGKKIISGGYGEINIDNECNTTGGMIPGTFSNLNNNPYLYLRNNQSYDNVIGYIDNGIIKINCENTIDDIEVEWMVIGERKDKDIKNLQITDNQGRLLCEQQQ